MKFKRYRFYQNLLREHGGRFFWDEQGNPWSPLSVYIMTSCSKYRRVTTRSLSFTFILNDYVLQSHIKWKHFFLMPSVTKQFITFYLFCKINANCRLTMLHNLEHKCGKIRFTWNKSFSVMIWQQPFWKRRTVQTDYW